MALYVKRKMKGGFFKTTPNGKVFYAQSDDYGNITELIDPIELIDFSRSCEFQVLLVREFNDSNSFQGKTKALFAIDYRVKLVENIGENIYIKFEPSNKKYYLRDLAEGSCCELGLYSNQAEIILSKSEPHKVTQAEAKEIMKTSGYCFGKCEVQENGELEFFVTV
jgi:hypothetical protein